MAIQVR